MAGGLRTHAMAAATGAHVHSQLQANAGSTAGGSGSSSSSSDGNPAWPQLLAQLPDAVWWDVLHLHLGAADVGALRATCRAARAYFSGIAEVVKVRARPPLPCPNQHVSPSLCGPAVHCLRR